MEPLNDNTEKPENSKPIPPKKPDRVSIGKIEAYRLDGWLMQITQASKGFLLLSKSDVVNFLIRQHKDVLAPKELQRIRSDHYDPVQHITWITPQIKAALASGNLERVTELQAELRGVELSVIRDLNVKHPDTFQVSSSLFLTRKKTKRKTNSESKSESKPMSENTEDDRQPENFQSILHEE